MSRKRSENSKYARLKEIMKHMPLRVPIREVQKAFSDAYDGETVPANYVSLVRQSLAEARQDGSAAVLAQPKYSRLALLMNVLPANASVSHIREEFAKKYDGETVASSYISLVKLGLGVARPKASCRRHASSIRAEVVRMVDACGGKKPLDRLLKSIENCGGVAPIRRELAALKQAERSVKT